MEIVYLFDFLLFLQKSKVPVCGATFCIACVPGSSLCVLFLEKIEETVGAANEVRVVGVDICVLNLKEVHDHVSCWRETLVEHVLHHVTDPRFQLVVARQARKFDSNDNSSQLFVHLISAVERGLEEPGDLLANQNLERAFWNEQTGGHRAGVLDGCLNLHLAQILKGIDVVDRVAERRVENVVDTGTTSQLDHRLLHEATLKLVSVRLLEFVDQMQNEWLRIGETAVIHGIVREGILQALGQFAFFVKESGFDLGVELRESLFYVVYENSVERCGKEWNSKLIGDPLVIRMFTEVPRFCLHGIFDAHFIDDILLGTALNSIVAQLKMVCGTI